MTIRPKVVALVALLFAMLILLDVGIQRQIVLPNFTELEHANARTAMTRIRYAVDRNLERLQGNVEEWANWAELYQFMQDRNPTFVSTYTTSAAVAPLKINLLMLVDRDGRVVLATARDLESGQNLPLDFAALRALPADFPWLGELRSGRAARGLIRTNQGVMLLAEAPIFNGDRTGTSMGMAVMGRLLNDAELKLIGVQAQATLRLLQAPRSSTASELVELDRETQVYGTFDDLHGKPVMTLRVDIPRTIAASGQAAVQYSTVYLFVAATIVLVLLLVFLHRVVLRPIGCVTRHAVAVGDGGDLTARLDFRGGDEIGRLAREFDRMVVRVAESRRQLAEQSFQAGSAELAKGVMHNLGNAMTPLGVRLSLLSTRLNDAPVNDVVMAARELAEPDVPDERRADLALFVALGCDEINSVLVAGREDLAAMERQCATVIATLAEQMVGIRNEQWVEGT